MPAPSQIPKEPALSFYERAAGFTFVLRTATGDVVLGTLEKGPEAALAVAACERIARLAETGRMALDGFMNPVAEPDAGMGRKL